MLYLRDGYTFQKVSRIHLKEHPGLGKQRRWSADELSMGACPTSLRIINARQADMSALERAKTKANHFMLKVLLFSAL